MKTVLSFIVVICSLQGAYAMASVSSSRDVKTYMSYTTPIDPRKMVTIPDMDLSYALAATLVEWDSHKEISAAVAAKWEVISENTFRFHLHKDLKWSDGSLVTAIQVKKSFDRAFVKYPDDLRSLTNILTEIRATSPDTVDFLLKVNASESFLLGKLTEPNYGILKITDSGEIDLSKTTGPFSITEQTVSQVTLKRNPNWFKANSEMPENVYIRVPGQSFESETALLKDNWANMIETSSMINADILDTYKAGNYHVWRRPYDKMGVFRLNPLRSNSNSYELFKYLRKSLNRKTLFQNLSGYETTDQAFPKGFPLYDPHFTCDDSGAKLPDEFKKRSVQILLSPARINRVLRQNIIDELERITDIKPTVISVELQDLEKAKKLDNYDFYAGTVGMADPEPEGIMSYYFEGKLPMIPPSSENFVHKLDLARKEMNKEIRIQKMIELMTEATCKGHVLPLFHVSTVGIGRPELDFTNIPHSDESITLSKIRFKTVK